MGAEPVARTFFSQSPGALPIWQGDLEAAIMRDRDTSDRVFTSLLAHGGGFLIAFGLLFTIDRIIAH